MLVELRKTDAPALVASIRKIDEESRQFVADATESRVDPDTASAINFHRRVMLLVEAEAALMDYDEPGPDNYRGSSWFSNDGLDYCTKPYRALFERAKAAVRPIIEAERRAESIPSGLMDFPMRRAA